MQNDAALKAKFSTTLQRLGGDWELMENMASITLEDFPILVGMLHDELIKDKLEEAAISAHSLQGLLATFDSIAPVKQIQSISRLAKSGDRAQALLILKDVRQDLALLTIELNFLLSQP